MGCLSECGIEIVSEDNLLFVESGFLPTGDLCRHRFILICVCMCEEGESRKNAFYI